MPPLNAFIDDEISATIESPDKEGSKDSSIRSSSSTSSFDRELNELDDPAWKFALAPTTTITGRSRRRSRNNKSVTFNPHVQLEYLPNRYDWSVEEKASRWISATEYTIFQLDISNTVFLLRNDPESIDDDYHTSRGVECKDPIATRRRRNTRKEARNVVFERQKIRKERQQQQLIEEQQQQQDKDKDKDKDNDDDDDDDDDEDSIYLIASMYSHIAKNSMRQALNFAAQDELDVKNNLHNVYDCFFDNNWISSVSSTTSTNSGYSSSLSSSVDLISPPDDDNNNNNKNDDDEFGFCILGDTLGFDNSWLMGDVDV
jgi:hypothetical protein